MIVRDQNTLKRLSLLTTLITAGLAVSGCSLFNLGGGAEEPVEEAAAGAEATAAVQPTAITLAPTLPQAGEATAAPAEPAEPTPTAVVEEAEGDQAAGGEGTPTELPPPTQITPPTPEEGAAEGEAPIQPVTGDGISITPAVGEPLDIIVVNGSGFAPGETVTLHWAEPDGPTGGVYVEVDADENGSFNVGLIVPPVDQWPGGPPAEMDFIQLRARSESLGDFYYFANFRYVKRFNPSTSLVQNYQNSEYGYSIDLPNAWTWSWVEDDTSDVRFTAPSAVGSGFIRVLETSDVSGAIQTVMPQEAPGRSYTTADLGAGAYPGTQATADNGLVVWFIPGNGRVYALSFTDDNGQFFEVIAASFRLD